MKNKVTAVVGTIGCAIVSSLALVGGVLYGLHWLVSLLDYDTLRWVTVGLILVLPVAVIVTNRMSSHWAREHVAGFDRGLDGAERTMTAMGRGLSATASLARTANRPVPANRPAAADLEKLLPQVGGMRLIEAADTEGDIIDL